MKRIFMILSLIPISVSDFGQAITINSADMPVPATAYNCVDFTSSSAPDPAISANAYWDYSAYTGTAFTNLYSPETDTFFTNAGIDVNFPETKTLTPGFGYFITSEIDFNATDIKKSGTNIIAQTFNLSSFTSSSADSLVIPAQKALLTTPEEIVHFPCTAGSAWSSVSRRVTNYLLTLGTAGFVDTPGQQVYYIHRTDTIVGWGNLRVYTPAGHSIQYNVLVDKIAQYSTDSFYLGGLPTPIALLSSFGITQGQKTDTAYRYNFYRKGSFNYLLSFYYGGDATYTTPAGKYQDTDGITTANAAVKNVDEAMFTTVLFPNPSSGSEINLLFTGKDVHAAKYSITDITGRTVQAGMADMKHGALHVNLDNKPANGNYFISITDNENNKIVTEQFIIAQ